MNRIKTYIIELILFAVPLLLWAQKDPSAACKVEEGRIIFELDQRWTTSQRKEFFTLFNLDSSVWQKIKSEHKEIILDSVKWNLRKLSTQVIELSRDLIPPSASLGNKFDVFLTDESWKVPPGYVDQERIIYGINNFRRSNVFNYEKGMATFFLPGYKRSSKVYIAGSFNKWDPRKTAMQLVDSGWMVKLPLAPGKYFYKYIVDGNWMTDPNNNLNENDGQGNINSALYCPNQKFKLNGYKSARKVMIAGSFNNWNKNELPMHPSEEGWTISMYLKEGTFTYKFLVNNEWIADPANKNSEKTEDKSSIVAKGDEHLFRLNGFNTAKKVMLAGTFNNWKPNELAMKKASDGWQLAVKLAPGNYEYKFIVDGRWMYDNSNPYITGQGDLTNSCLAFKANYVFKLNAYPKAKNVYVTGSFNDWNEPGYRMTKVDGVWTFPIYLAKGKQLYKFIIDGKWILDPANKIWDQNEFGTGNSVLWIK
jgi:hypothetical protein